MNSIISTLSLVLLLTAGLMFSAGSSQAAPAPAAMPAPVAPAAQTVAECLAACQAQLVLDLAACKPSCYECDLWVSGVCISGSYNGDCLTDCNADAEAAYNTCRTNCKDVDPQGQG